MSGHLLVVELRTSEHGGVIAEDVGARTHGGLGPVHGASDRASPGAGAGASGAAVHLVIEHRLHSSIRHSFYSFRLFLIPA